MQAPLKPWETTTLQNNAQVIKNANQNCGIGGNFRTAPVLPPRPQNSLASNYSPYSPYSSYGGMNYGAYSSLPYRSSLYSGYGGYGGYSGYGNYSGYGGYGMYGMNGYPSFNNQDDAERRFIQFAEERSRSTFSNIENVVSAVNSLAMMLDNTFFALTSSFRAVLSVAEHFGRLRSVFGHIWYSINILRLFTWFYRKVLALLGRKVPNSKTNIAWKEVTGSNIGSAGGGSSSSTWSTLTFVGLLVSAPYFISKLLPKYEDKADPRNWKLPGVRAKAAFDFIPTASNEMALRTNDEITLAPTYIQEEMKLVNTGWVFATCNGKSGVVPLNYLVLVNNNNNNITNNEVPVPRIPNNNQVPLKSSLKKVSFGQNQVVSTEDIDKLREKNECRLKDEPCKEQKTSETQLTIDTTEQQVDG